jgi:hypothetical protein
MRRFPEERKNSDTYNSSLNSTGNIGKGKCKGKGKFHPRTDHEGPECELRYSSTLSLTSAIDGVGGQRYAPAALSPGKAGYPVYRRLGGPPSVSGWMR